MFDTVQFGEFLLKLDNLRAAPSEHLTRLNHIGQFLEFLSPNLFAAGQ